MSDPITVMIVDDHEMVRRGASGYLEAQPDIEVQCLGAFPQPFDVLVEERDYAVVQAQALPYAVTEDETGIEYRYHRLVPVE